jgi:uncharacterized membrane protein (DUF485 family)
MLKGAITTYVMMMFGLIIVLYLMGFTSPWMAYTAETVGPEGEETGIASPTGIGTNILDWMMNGVYSLFEEVASNPLIAVISTIVTLGAFYLISKVGGQYVLAYIIPIIILAIFANIFIFPTSTLQGQILFPLDIVVFGFLNLFLILSYIDFVKGTS